MDSRNSLLIIKTGAAIHQAAEFGDFDDWIRDGSGLGDDRIVVCRVDEGEILPGAAEFGAAIITGSPAMVTERLPWSERAADWLVDAAAARLPILGICYGHQLLAHAFGGLVEPDPSGREIGTVSVELNYEGADDALLGRLPDTFFAQATHVESVTRLPDGAVELARSEHPANHAFRIGELVWGVQFHPEFDDAVMRSYLEARADVIREEGLDPEALLANVKPAPRATGILRRFAELAGLV
jgi:GMP synthase (glutamine-hydrolysing)